MPETSIDLQPCRNVFEPSDISGATHEPVKICHEVAHGVAQFLVVSAQSDARPTINFRNSTCEFVRFLSGSATIEGHADSWTPRPEDDEKPTHRAGVRAFQPGLQQL
jgi:hypothetical protein